MGTDDRLGNCQTKTRAPLFPVAAVIGAVKAIEDMGDVLVRNTLSPILDTDLYPLSRF